MQACVFQREMLGDWQDMNIVYVASALAGLAPVIFLFLKVYGRSDFSPKMEQEREITLGCKDPITQQHRIYRLLLEEGYSMIDAKNYLSIMQEYAPHLSGVVLAGETENASSLLRYGLLLHCLLGSFVTPQPSPSNSQKLDNT